MTIVINGADVPLSVGQFYSIGLDGPPWGTIYFTCTDCSDGNCPQPIDCAKDYPNGEIGPIPDCQDIVAHCTGHPDKALR